LATQLRAKEKEADAAMCKVTAVEDEMRVLLGEMAEQTKKISRLNRAFAELAV
jgi:hypothetical protein